MLELQLPRYSTSLGLGLLITGGLLFVMQSLIATGRYPLVEPVRYIIPPLVPTQTIDPPRERTLPEEIDPPPPQPSIEGLTDDRGGGRITVVVPAPPGPGPTVDQQPTGVSDGAPIPLVKVAAVYPPRAIDRGLEGYVIVEYTVTRTGSVADVRVAESSHTLFERNAVAAAEQFRYRPRIVAGEAVDTPGVLNRFTFSLEN